jgi:hypothetical protein
MKINDHQLDALERNAELVHEANYPWGNYCHTCFRFHVFTYSDGTQVCAKCDELVCIGALLTPNVEGADMVRDRL